MDFHKIWELVDYEWEKSLLGVGGLRLIVKIGRPAIASNSL